MEKNDRIRLCFSCPKLLDFLNLILKALKLLTLYLIETLQSKSVWRLKNTNRSFDLHVLLLVALIRDITCKSIKSIFNWFFVWPWNNYSDLISLIYLLIKILNWGNLSYWDVLPTMLLYFGPSYLSTTILIKYCLLIYNTLSRFFSSFIRRLLSLVDRQTDVDIHWAWLDLKALGVATDLGGKGLRGHDAISHIVHALKQ